MISVNSSVTDEEVIRRESFSTELTRHFSDDHLNIDNTTIDRLSRLAKSDVIALSDQFEGYLEKKSPSAFRGY